MRFINRERKKIFGIVIVFFVAVSMFLGNNNVYARSSTVNIQQEIRDKVIYHGVYQCYVSNALAPSVVLSNYHDIGSILNMASNNRANTDGNFIPLISGSEGSNININGSVGGYNVRDDGLSCRQLLVGDGSNAPSILQFSGKPEPTANDISSRKEFLKEMGYIESSSGSSESDLKCYSAVVKDGNSEYLSNMICQDSDKKLSFMGQSPRSLEFYSDSSNRLCLRLFASSQTGRVTDEKGCAPIGGDISPQSLHIAIQMICGGDECELNKNGVTTRIGFYDRGSGYVEQQVGGDSDLMVLQSPASDAGLKAIRYLSGMEYTPESLRINSPEKRILYQEYLTMYYGVEINCAEDALSANLGTVRWFDASDGGMKNCQITRGGNDKRNSPVNGVNALGNLGYHNIANLDELLAALNSDDMRDYTEDELVEMGAVMNGSRVDSESTDDCRNSSAGKGLGWLLCSVLELAGSAVEGIYDGLIEPRLGVNPKLFSSGSTSDEQIPYFAWQQFRDIANMIFVILLLVVLFSQLTGVGIDNYGIKRILPKLIVSAILINLSYLICILVIDVSNIVGNGAAALFDNLGRSLPTTVNLSTDSGAVGATGATGSLVTVGLAAGMATMVGSIWTAGPLILVTLLPTVLSALVAFLFLFLLLSARQAAVVVLVVLSPLAVACNILPNTKSFFDRYLKAFKLLMLVYPIASVLISGGNYVSKLILQINGDGDNFFLALTSMVVGIAPIFFIPSMIKDSFVGLGKIGGALSGFGRAAGNKAAGVLRGNEGFKDLQRMSTERRARKLAGVRANGEIKKLGTLGTIMRGGRRRVSEARSQYMSDQASEAARSELLNGGLFAQRLESAEEARALKASREMYANMDRKGLSDDAGEINTWLKEKGGYQRAAMLMEAMVNKGMQTDVYKMLENNNFSGSSSVMNSLAGSSDKILKAYGKKAAGNGTSFTSFMNGTGKGAGGETITLKKYAGEKGASFLSGLDDKALELIKGYSTGSNQIMSTNQLLGAAKSMDSDDALVWINKMLKGRNDISFSAADYFDYDESIRETIRQKYRYHDASVMQSVQAAVEAIDNDPSLASKMGKDDALFFGSIPRSSGGGTP